MVGCHHRFYTWASSRLSSGSQGLVEVSHQHSRKREVWLPCVIGFSYLNDIWNTVSQDLGPSKCSISVEYTHWLLHLFKTAYQNNWKLPGSFNYILFLVLFKPVSPSPSAPVTISRAYKVTLFTYSNIFILFCFSFLFSTQEAFL